MKFPLPAVVLGICLAAAITLPGKGANQYSSRRWQMEDGLPNNAVFAVAQTRDGYLWAGTAQGLARFDGVRFVSFTSQTTPEIKGQSVRSLFVAKDGTLWIGTEKGLCSFKDGKFSASAWFPGMLVKALCESRDGTLLIGTINGVASYRDGKCTWFRNADGLSNEAIFAICADQQDNVWLGTGQHITLYKNAAGRLINQLVQTPGQSVRTLFCDRSNRLWFGTDGAGVGRVFGFEGRTLEQTNGLSDMFINALLEERNGEFWVGTQSGLFRRQDNRFVPQLNSEGLPYETVFCLAEDREGNLWIGSKEGLTELRPKSFVSYTTQQGLSYDNVMSVCEGRDGTIWLPTWGGGLSVWQGTNVIPYSGRNTNIYDLLLSVCEDHDGVLWLGADFDGGLFSWKNGVFTRFCRNEGIITGAIRVIHEDRQNRLWLGSSGALYVREGPRFRQFTTADGLSGNIIRAVIDDRDGGLWIGTDHGLTRWRDGKFQSVTDAGAPTNQVTALYQDADCLWLGTDGGGLARFRAGKFVSFTTRQGLFSDSVLEILEDAQGNLWMSCLAGVFRMKKSELDDVACGKSSMASCASYGRADGMASVLCNGVAKPAGWKARDGRLMFPTTRGVTVVDPNSVHENAVAPTVVIEEVMADRQNVLNAGQSAQIGEQTSGVTIAPGRGELEIHYTALSLTAPEKNRFKYKLEGFDTEWIDVGTRRFAYYNNIKPGHYTFRLIACNNDGVWNSVGTSLGLDLLPHYWQTNWFLAAVALGAIGLVAGTARYVTWKKVQHKLLWLENQHAIEKERSRIAQDMHDDLGAQLTEILLLSEVAMKSETAEAAKKQVGEVVDVAREVVRNLDGIVWAVNPQNDSLERLAGYIHEYAEVYLRRSSIRCWMTTTPERLPNIPLSSEVRHSIFLTLKEALHNTVKHSGASEVKISLVANKTNLSLAIADNGKGFSTEKVSSYGNGLRNMRKRIEQIGGTFSLQTTAGRGTGIELTIPLLAIPSAERGR